MKKVYRGDPNGYHEIIQSPDGGYAWVSEDMEYANIYAEREYAESPLIETLYFKPDHELDLTSVNMDGIIAERNENGDLVPTQDLMDLAEATGIDAQTLLSLEDSSEYKEDDLDAEHVWEIVKRKYFADLLQEKGCKGVKQIESGHVTHGFLDSTQIKSATDNIGTFGVNDRRHRYSIESQTSPTEITFDNIEAIAAQERESWMRQDSNHGEQGVAHFEDAPGSVRYMIDAEGNDVMAMSISWYWLQHIMAGMKQVETRPTKMVNYKGPLAGREVYFYGPMTEYPSGKKSSFPLAGHLIGKAVILDALPFKENGVVLESFKERYRDLKGVDFDESMMDLYPNDFGYILGDIQFLDKPIRAKSKNARFFSPDETETSPEALQVFANIRQGIDPSLMKEYTDSHPRTRLHVTAEEAISSAIEGVTEEMLKSSIRDIIENKRVAIKMNTPEEAEIILSGAMRFFREYSTRKIPLSTGSYLYFVPHPNAINRYNGDKSLAWAEYAIHAVTNDDHRMRKYNPNKANEIMGRIEEIVHENIVTIGKNGYVEFNKQLSQKRVAVVIARPTIAGNYVADLANTTISFKKKLPANTMPLDRVSEAYTQRGDSLNTSTDAISVAPTTPHAQGILHQPPAIDPSRVPSAADLLPQDFQESMRREISSNSENEFGSNAYLVAMMMQDELRGTARSDEEYSQFATVLNARIEIPDAREIASETLKNNREEIIRNAKQGGDAGELVRDSARIVERDASVVLLVKNETPAEEQDADGKLHTRGLDGLSGEAAREKAYEQAEENIQTLSDITDEAAGIVGGTVLIRPVNKAGNNVDPREVGKAIKKRDRVNKKVASDYAGDYSRCVDLIGTTLVMPDNGDYTDTVKKSARPPRPAGARSPRSRN